MLGALVGEQGEGLQRAADEGWQVASRNWWMEAYLNPGRGLEAICGEWYTRWAEATAAAMLERITKTQDYYLFGILPADVSKGVPPPGAAGLKPGPVFSDASFIIKSGLVSGDLYRIERGAHLVDLALTYGWDREYGGLFFLVNKEGKPGAWKLSERKPWCNHCEALYAALLAYAATHERRYLRWFQKLHDWSFAHFPDPEYGEWFMHLYRDGSPPEAGRKGMFHKAAYHVPRTLLRCWRLFEELAQSWPEGTQISDD